MRNSGVMAAREKSQCEGADRQVVYFTVHSLPSTNTILSFHILIFFLLCALSVQNTVKAANSRLAMSIVLRVCFSSKVTSDHSRTCSVLCL